MKDYNAYCKYTAPYNDFAPSCLPRLSSAEHYMQQTEQLKRESGISEKLSVYWSNIGEISEMV